LFLSNEITRSIVGLNANETTIVDAVAQTPAQPLLWPTLVSTVEKMSARFPTIQYKLLYTGYDSYTINYLKKS
jgi:hypothetical protein